MSTRTLISRWVARNRQVFSPGTCTLYKGVIWRFEEFIPSDVRNLRVVHIEHYVAHLLDKDHLKRSSVNTHLGAIKSFCKWVSENYDVPNESLKIKVLKADPANRRFISPKQYARILAVCSEDEARVVKLLSHTGLRAAELQNLQEGNVHGHAIRFSGKGRKERTVPLNETAYKCIHENGKPNLDFLKSFRHRNALYDLCVRLSKRAGLKTIANPHALRRYFGKSLLDKGVGIFPISKLYGHADVSTTLMYLTCSGEELQGVTDCLD